MTRDPRDGSASTKNFGVRVDPNAIKTTVSPPPTVTRDRRAPTGGPPAMDAERHMFSPRDTLPGGPHSVAGLAPPTMSRSLESNRITSKDPHRTLAMKASAPGDAPSMTGLGDPPEVDLTQHALPADRPFDDRLVLFTEPDSERASSFRVLRHHIMESGQPQVIVVSSPNPREGKTTVAVNLALALAECNRARVLLVEASLRKPQLAVVFGFEPPWCFAEQLSAHRHQPLLPWGLVDIPELFLHVAAIDPRSEQVQLLDAPAFAIAMERLRLARYDHIVIDAPAVLGSAEVNLMQDGADGVLLTAMGKSTTARDMRQAVYQLTPTKLLGTVLLER